MTQDIEAAADSAAQLIASKIFFATLAKSAHVDDIPYSLPQSSRPTPDLTGAGGTPNTRKSRDEKLAEPRPVQGVVLPPTRGMRLLVGI